MGRERDRQTNKTDKEAVRQRGRQTDSDREAEGKIYRERTCSPITL